MPFMIYSYSTTVKTSGPSLYKLYDISANQPWYSHGKEFAIAQVNATFFRREISVKVVFNNIKKQFSHGCHHFQSIFFA